MNKQVKDLSQSMLESLVAIPWHINYKDTVLPIKSLFIYDPNQSLYVCKFEGQVARLVPFNAYNPKTGNFDSDIDFNTGKTQEGFNNWLYKNFREVSCPPELQIKKNFDDTIVDYAEALEEQGRKITGNHPIFTFKNIKRPSGFHVGELIRIMTPFSSYKIGEIYPTIGLYRSKADDKKLTGYDNPHFNKLVYAPFKLLIVNKNKMELIPLANVESTHKYDLLFILRHYSIILLSKLKGK